MDTPPVAIKGVKAAATPPSVKSTIPWTGFVGLCIAAAGTVATCIVLWASDGTPLESWSFKPTPITFDGHGKVVDGAANWAASRFTKHVNGHRVSPNVLISIMMIFINLGVQLAFSQGLAVWWWRRVYKGRQPSQLREDWAVGTSKLGALKATLNRKKTSVMSLATVCVALLAAANPLLQRSVWVDLKEIFQDRPVAITLAKVLPFGFYTGFRPSTSTGSMSSKPPSHGNLPPTNMLMSYLYASQVETPYAQGIPIQVFNSSGCDGECEGTVHGAGFSVICADSKIPYQGLPPKGTPIGGWTSQPVPIFAGGVGMQSNNANTITITTIAKTSSAQSGELQSKTCILTPALVEHQVLFSANVSEPHKPWNVTFLSYSWDTVRNPVVRTTFDKLFSQTATTGVSLTPDFLGGIYLSLRNRFMMELNLELNAGTPNITVTGPFDPKYIDISSTRSANTYEELAVGGISFHSKFYDELMLDALIAAREFMFRSAALAATLQFQGKIQHGNYDQNYVPSGAVTRYQLAYQQQASMTQWRLVQAYSVSYAWLGAALAVILVAAGATTPLFYRFWTLGARRTMNPAETARVFVAAAEERPAVPDVAGAGLKQYEKAPRHVWHSVLEVVDGADV